MDSSIGIGIDEKCCGTQRLSKSGDRISLTAGSWSTQAVFFYFFFIPSL
jgi:hypothetical protein